MFKKLIYKFLGLYTLVILITVFILNFFAGLKLKDLYEEKISQRLANNSYLIGRIILPEIKGSNSILITQKVDELASDLKLRITVIGREGVVVADSEQDPFSMDNHKDRPEMVRAINDGLGESDRYSDTLSISMKYVAVSLWDKDELLGVVRVSMPLLSIETQVKVIYRIILIASILAVFFALIMGYFTSQSIVNPISKMKDIAQNIEQGDFKKRTQIKTRDEIGQLARSIDKMADELEHKIENLHRADKLKTNLIANVSHELKTPLTSIKGFIETLEDGAIDDKENAKRFISIIKQRTQGLSNIIDDLLSLSELESSPKPLEKTRFDLKDFFQEVKLGFGFRLSQSDKSLNIDFLGQDFNILADRVWVEQIIVNLIDNAIKYTKPLGTINIRVIAKEQDFTLEFIDDGIGIAQKHIDKVFERFYRADKSRSREAGGTGLGLAIVKHIVLLHKGSISIASRIGQGTKVIVELPKH